MDAGNSATGHETQSGRSSPIRGLPARRGSKSILVGLLALLVVLAITPTIWGALTSMGLPQWLEAIALGLVFAPASIGIYLTFRVLDFPDLTVDGSFPAGGAIAAVLITNNISAWLALPAAMLLGAVLGLVTALLHILLKINSLLASIITLTAAFTVNLRIQGSANISLLNDDRIFSRWLEPIKGQLDSWFGTAGVQVHRSVTTALMTFLIVLAAFIALRWFFSTEIGLAMRATGANREMSQSQAIDTAKYLVSGVALSNGLVGLTGALFVQHAGFADINAGSGLIVAGLAAVIIGEVLFGGKSTSISRRLAAVALGMLVYRFAIALALNADLRLPGTDGFRLEASDIKLATAAVVVVMLAAPRIREHRSEQARRRIRA